MIIVFHFVTIPSSTEPSTEPTIVYSVVTYNGNGRVMPIHEGKRDEAKRRRWGKVSHQIRLIHLVLPKVQDWGRACSLLIRGLRVLVGTRKFMDGRSKMWWAQVVEDFSPQQ